MSSGTYDVARGGYSAMPKQLSGSSKISGLPNASTSKSNKRNREVSLETTTASAESIKKYEGRDRNIKEINFKGSVMKKRPGKEVNYGDKKMIAKMEMTENKRIQSAIRAAEAEILETQQSGFIEVENEMERTYKLKQMQLKGELDEQSQRQIYDLNLDSYAPYNVNYTRDGRHMLLSGNGGHVALMDALTLTLQNEFHLNASNLQASTKTNVKDSTFLQNMSLYALAETKSVCIYDASGAEIHNLRDHVAPLALEFLPYHWLLCSIGEAGYLKYTDTSTGNLVSQHCTKLGPCAAMCYNPSNAVMHCGHSNGTVTLWSPSSSSSLVKMQCHRGTVTDLKIDLEGNHMVTSGVDGQIKVWDVRNYKLIHSYYSKTGVSSIDISQTGVIAVGGGSHVTFWKDAIKQKAKDPYMHHSFRNGSIVNDVKFRPFEDVCGIGHSKGFSSIVIPGVGEANFDSYENNMFGDKKQRDEHEIRSLLDKLTPDMISLDPNVVGQVERDRGELMKEQREIVEEANRNKPKEREKKKMRGRSKIAKKLAGKHKNILDEGKKKLIEVREGEKKEKAEREGGEYEGNTKEERKKIKGIKEGGGLERFF